MARPETFRDRVAARIAGGEDPKAVVREALKASPARSAGEAFWDLVACLRDRGDRLAGRVGQVHRMSPGAVETLREARGLIDRLLVRAEELAAEEEAYRQKGGGPRHA